MVNCGSASTPPWSYPRGQRFSGKVALAPRCIYGQHGQYIAQSVHLLGVFAVPDVSKSLRFSMANLATIMRVT
jgi:hypothetical protein